MSSVECVCTHCGKEFHVKKSRYERYNVSFCSRRCLSESKKAKCTCLECGKSFDRKKSAIKNTGNTYCSMVCFRKARKKIVRDKHPLYDRVTVTCDYCGEEFSAKPSVIRKGFGRYCSKKCSDTDKGNKFHGETHPSWKGGLSFEPYCHKFNENLRERVREFFGRKCVVCGRTEDENGRKLDVHHVNYNKNVCCDDTIPMFVPLCIICHVKTNSNREMWQEYFTNKIMTDYNGKCYFTKAELIALNTSNCTQIIPTEI